MRDELSGLGALLAVAEKRSFTLAAAELGVTPSAVSQTSGALERRVLPQPGAPRAEAAGAGGLPQMEAAAELNEVIDVEPIR